MSENYDYDVAFIGSGQGAWNGAIPMAQSGLKVAVIESGLWGGVCTNRGCNAKYTLDKPAELVTQIKQLQGRGFDSVPAINWPDLMNHKHEVIGPLSDSNRQKLINAGAVTIEGFATFKNSHTLEVNGKDLSAEKIVIVSGQRPKRLDIPGKEYLHDSTDFLSLTPLPKNIAILGAGYVGMEFASIASIAGAKVTVIVDSDQVLKSFDQAATKQLVNLMRQSGVQFIFSQVTTEIQKVDDDHFIVLGENDFKLETNYVLDATGRTPNIEKLHLENTSVTTNGRGVLVNDHLQTAESNIYATGDVIAKNIPKITPTAIYESQYLAKLFTKKTTDPIRYPAVATNVFTMPRLAQCGITVAQAKKYPDRFSIEHYDYASDWFRQVQNETSGGLTVIFDQTTNRMVGAVDLSNDAPTTINTLLTYIEFGLTADQVHQLIYIFPSIQHSAMRKI